MVDVINIDGKLYGKNGTTYPVRMILIDGRKKDVYHGDVEIDTFNSRKLTENKVTELFCIADDVCKFFDAMMEKYYHKSPF